MGYYTWYQIKVVTPTPLSRQREAAKQLICKLYDEHNLESMVAEIESDTPFAWVSYEEMKWYDFETDMVDLARKFPDIGFVITGEGEDREDTWRMYLRGDKFLYHKMAWPDAPDWVFEEERKG